MALRHFVGYINDLSVRFFRLALGLLGGGRLFRLAVSSGGGQIFRFHLLRRFIRFGSNGGLRAVLLKTGALHFRFVCHCDFTSFIVK